MPEIVVIGGGTGTYTTLVGLKHYPVRLTAIVSMADDGGSSGRLRDEFGHLPPGDVRRCLLALSPDDAAPTVRTLFEYRFDRGSGLAGHSFGNLMLTALTEITGSTELAIAEAARLLGVRGAVVPVTLSDSCLCAELEDGTIVRGESNIDIRRVGLECRVTREFLSPPAKANPAAIDAISRADCIVIGPGDLYSSILPNLLVEGISSAIVAARAVKIYVCNLMTKHGETDGFRASDFVRELHRHLGAGAQIDHLIFNDSRDLPDSLLQKYALERAFPVAADLSHEVFVGSNLHLLPLAAAGTLLRHNSARLAEVLIEILDQRRDSTLTRCKPVAEVV